VTDGEWASRITNRPTNRPTNRSSNTSHKRVIEDHGWWMTIGEEVMMDDGRSRMNTDGGTIASDRG
jgi:hypothetical protein